MHFILKCTIMKRTSIHAMWWSYINVYNQTNSLIPLKLFLVVRGTFPHCVNSKQKDKIIDAWGWFASEGFCRVWKLVISHVSFVWSGDLKVWKIFTDMSYSREIIYMNFLFDAKAWSQLSWVWMSLFLVHFTYRDSSPEQRECLPVIRNKNLFTEPREL